MAKIGLAWQVEFISLSTNHGSTGTHMYKPTKRFNRLRGKAIGALIIGSIATLTALNASAAIVDSGVVNIPVPQTFDGIYLNFVTGASGTSGASVPGWDFDPYGATTLGIFWATLPAAPTGSGMVAPATTTPLLILAPGTTVSSAGTFTKTIAAAASLRTGFASAYIGVAFLNEATGATNYGWVEFSTTSPTGYPATIVRYAYENTGQPITAGTTPVSLQSFGID